MARGTPIARYLIRADRVVHWVLLAFLIIFIITGYSLTGEYGLNGVVSVATALWIHTMFSELVVALLAYHVLVRGYPELRRYFSTRKRRDAKKH